MALNIKYRNLLKLTVVEYNSIKSFIDNKTLNDLIKGKS